MQIIFIIGRATIYNNAHCSWHILDAFLLCVQKLSSGGSEHSVQQCRYIKSALIYVPTALYFSLLYFAILNELSFFLWSG